MANIKSTARVTQIFDDLDKYRNFCRDYGYRFNEAELYNNRSHTYKQYQRFLTGKYPRNQWNVDYAKYKNEEARKPGN